MELTSKDYSWAYITADRCLRQGPCELIYACLVPSGASTINYLKNGTDTNGDTIICLECAAVTNRQFSPRVPIYCDKGLWVDVGTGTTAILVIWRNL